MVSDLKELVRYDFEVVDADDTISKISHLMDKLDPEKANAILVKDGKEILGVIREKELIRSSVMKNPHETKIRNFVIRTGILTPDKLTVENVVRRFVEDSTPFVIVREDGKSGKYGVIYINDFLRTIKDEFKDMKVREVMNKDVITIRNHDTIAKALSVMRNNGIDRLVVVNSKNKVVGMITGRDIIDRVLVPKKRARMGDGKGEKEKTLSIMVESIMSYPVVTAERNDSVADLIEQMVEHRISSVVITQDDIPEGIVIKKDILEHLLKKKVPMEYSVQIITRDLTLDDFDKQKIADDLDRFIRKFREFLGGTIMFVYIKRHKENFRGLPLIHVRIKLTSDRGTFFASGESWGVEFAVHVTLKKLEREILKEKELLMDQRMVKRFYEEVFEF
jgi:CBS domain-containing protein